MTFNIISRVYRPYKFFIISGLPKNNNKPTLIMWVLLKYLDTETYDKLFSYLNTNFKFKPKIIHSAFEQVLCKSISINPKTKSIIHVKCLFHFTQMVRKQFSKTGIIKKN